MQTLAQIREMLAVRGLAPRKALGQNFLIDKNLLGKLVAAADLPAEGAGAAAGAGPAVLEVGPGTGTLTEALLERGARVVACELDEGLADLLTERLPREIAAHAWPGTFQLVRGDALAGPREVNPRVVGALGAGAFKLVANLPYGAATPLILTLLIRHPACTAMAVTIQREVADRLLAGPGSKAYGTLGIVAQAMAEVERVAVLPRECFWPRPDVTSAMVRLRRRARALARDPGALAALCTRLFSKRRKQLGAILGPGAALPPGVGATQRPEELTVEQLVALADEGGRQASVRAVR